MANRGSLTTSLDRRNIEPKIKQVWENVLTYTIEADGGASEIKVAVPTNGIIKFISVVIGAAGGITGTINIAIDDNADAEIFSDTSLAESSTNNYHVDLPVSGIIDVGINPSDDPTTGQDDWTIVVTLRGI